MPRPLLASLAAIAAWVVLLGALELGLRVAGFRFSLPAFEILSERRVLEPAGPGHVTVARDLYEARGYQFQYMSPPPAEPYSLEKKPGTLRVLFVGDSSGGWFEQTMPRFRPCLEKSTGLPLEFINLSFSGCGSERTRSTVLEAMALRPDVLVVSTGHSDFVSLCNPATFGGPKAEDLRYSQGFRRAFERWRVLQLAARLGSRWVAGTLPQDQIMGATRAMQRNFNAAEREAMYAFQRRNFEEIAAEAGRRGVPAVFVTMARNYDVPPLWEGGQKVQLEPFQRLGERELRELERSKPGPLTAWFLGQKLWAKGRIEEARRLMDEGYGRSERSFVATATTNQIIRDVARAHGAGLVDAQALVDRASPRGLADGTLMFDHCHIKAEGNFPVADSLCASIGALISGKKPASR